MIIHKRQLETRTPALETVAPNRLGASTDVVFNAPVSKAKANKFTVAKATNGGFCPAYWTQLILNSLPLLLADLLALGCSLGCAYILASWLLAATPFEFGWILMLTALTMPATFAVLRLYPGTGLNAVAELGKSASRRLSCWRYS